MRSTIMIAMLALTAGTALPAGAGMVLEETKNPSLSGSVERARVRVEQDRAKLHEDTASGADSSTLKADDTQLNIDVHVLSALTREYNHEKAQKADKPAPRLVPSDIDTD